MLFGTLSSQVSNYTDFAGNFHRSTEIELIEFRGPNFEWSDQRKFVTLLRDASEALRIDVLALAMTFVERGVGDSYFYPMVSQYLHRIEAMTTAGGTPAAPDYLQAWKTRGLAIGFLPDLFQPFDLEPNSRRVLVFEVVARASVRDRSTFGNCEVGVTLFGPGAIQLPPTFKDVQVRFHLADGGHASADLGDGCSIGLPPMLWDEGEVGLDFH